MIRTSTRLSALRRISRAWTKRRKSVAAAAPERPWTQATAYKKAPPGFTREQWQFFMREGYLLIEDAISPEDVRRYIDAWRGMK